MILFSDRGTPDGYHNMHGYSGHTYKFVREDGEWVYVQIHIRADGGFKVIGGRSRQLESLADRVNADTGRPNLC